jgi:Holliday junction resolvase
MVTNYARGRSVEYAVKRYLESDGYFVLRSAGSHSPVDLLAVKYMGCNSHSVLFVSCKKGQRLSPRERVEIQNLAKSYGAIPVLSVKKHNRWTVEPV